MTLFTVYSFSDAFAKIINLLLCDGLCIHYFKTVQIDYLLYIVVLIHFVEDLPGNVVVDLLEHFLKLILCDSIFLVRTVFAADVFFIGFLLKLSSNLFIFINNIITFLPQVKLTQWSTLIHSWVSSLRMDVVNLEGRLNIWVLGDQWGCPERNRPVIEITYRMNDLFFDWWLVIAFDYLWLWLFFNTLSWLDLMLCHVVFYSNGVVTVAAEWKLLVGYCIHWFLYFFNTIYISCE